MSIGRKEQLKVATVILIVVALVSSFALIAGPTGFVVGIPSSCTSKVSLSGQSSVELQPGELEEIKVTVSNISCGISYVRLRIEDIPQYYTTGPSFFASISPKETKDFSVFFDIPDDAEIRSYTGTYRLYTSEGKFSFGTLDFSIAAAEKPAKKIAGTGASSAEIELNEGAGFLINKDLLSAIAVLAAVLAFILAGYEYFAYSEKSARKEALKRPFAEIYKVLGTKKAKEASFESALKKTRKKKK